MQSTPGVSVLADSVLGASVLGASETAVCATVTVGAEAPCDALADGITNEAATPNPRTAAAVTRTNFVPAKDLIAMIYSKSFASRHFGVKQLSDGAPEISLKPFQPGFR